MAIWQRVRGKWSPVLFGHTRNVILCCNGPSLAKIDASKLCGVGRAVVAVNTAYPAVRPDYWLGMDDSACYDQRIFDEVFPKVFRGNYHTHRLRDGLLRDAAGCYFADTLDGGGMFRFLDDGKFSWHQDTFRVALQFALSLRAKNIFLAGVDLDNREGDYADGSYLTPAQRKRNTRLYKYQLAFLKSFNAEMQARELNLISCSEGSRINDFLPFVPMSEVVAWIDNAFPAERIKMHVMDRPKP